MICDTEICPNIFWDFYQILSDNGGNGGGMTSKRRRIIQGDKYTSWPKILNNVFNKGESKTFFIKHMVWYIEENEY